jgi:capsular exopolysaccharide synthesis family protein
MKEMSEGTVTQPESDTDPAHVGRVAAALASSRKTPDLVSVTHPRSAVAEAYRDLRTSLSFARPDGPLKSILVSSAGPAEGKSTTVANLAVAMAQAGTSVVVVDADLRRATLDKQFGVSNQFGLTNALFDQGNLSLYVRSTFLDKLRVLTSGPLPPNPSELLGSERMRSLLGELKSRFDCVLLDSAPVGSVSDALVLSPLVDGVVLVVHAGGLPREVVQRVKAKLDQSQARLLGVVLNKVDIEREQPYYYYYNYSSAYYGYPGPGEDGSR